MTYAFRFGSSDKLIHLTQEQLDCIPYLVTFVAHKDDFLSIQNENGEYVLNYPIEYNWFMPIFYSITSKQPYKLFNELSEYENILDVFQLFDYLGIQSFPLPLLKDKYLVQSNSINTENQKQHIEYHKANLSETRQTAAEFVIALAKNEYKLRDSSTKRSVFNLIKIIFFNTDVFNSRFRYHTLTVIKKYCYSYFSLAQQRQLQLIYRIAEYREVNSCMYISEDEKSLPEKFQNTFTWKGVYVPNKENNIQLWSKSFNIVLIGKTRSGKSTLMNSLFGNMEQASSPVYNYRDRPSDYFHLTMESDSIGPIYILDTPGLEINQHYDEKQCHMSQIKQAQRKNEAYPARSGHFNTLPKRPKIDKFKHRFGPKAQKYR